MNFICEIAVTDVQYNFGLKVIQSLSQPTSTAEY